MSASAALPFRRRIIRYFFGLPFAAIPCALTFGRIDRIPLVKKKKSLPPKFQGWVDARKKFRLSDAHIQMARELGMTPKSLAKLASHDQQSWKSPLTEFLEELYLKRFKRERPAEVISIEDLLKRKQKKKENQKDQKVKTVHETEESSDSEDPF
jgi:hypothetical protein